MYSQKASNQPNLQKLGIGARLRYIWGMGHLFHLLTVFVLACVSCNLAATEHDHVKARQLLEAGEVLPLEQILEQVRREHPGRILNVKLEEERGRHVYEMEMVDEEGHVWEVEYDATNGELIEKVKEE